VAAMVKIRNVYGDEYRGKQKHAVYQKRYGKQIRRLKEEHKRNDSPAQREQQRRFRVGLSWYKSLSYEEKEGLKFFLDQQGISLTPQQYAIKTALDRGKVTKEVFEEQVRTWVYKEGWDAEGWPYRQKIDITSTLQEDLVDFQVKLELDASKVGPHFRWDLQGRDLRFYDDKGTKIPHWIESWDEVNKRAVVWIKVPLIQQNAGADIYMYYGKEDAVSESDAESVFDFWDDFETFDTSKWDIIDTADYHISDGVLYVDETDAWFRLLSKQAFNNADGWVFETKAKYTSGAGTKGWFFYVGHGEIDGVSEELVGYFRYGNTWGGKHNGVVISFSGPAIQQDRWYILTLKMKGTHTEWIVDGVIYKTFDDTDIETRPVSVGSSNKGCFDWVRVRKYAEQEPTLEFGAEEEAGPGEPIVVTVEHIIVEHSGMQNVLVLDENGEVIKEYTNLSDIKNGDIATRLDFKNDTGRTVRTVIIESISGVLNKWTL